MNVHEIQLNALIIVFTGKINRAVFSIARGVLGSTAEISIFRSPSGHMRCGKIIYLCGVIFSGCKVPGP